MFVSHSATDKNFNLRNNEIITMVMQDDKYFQFSELNNNVQEEFKCILFHILKYNDFDAIYTNSL